LAYRTLLLHDPARRPLDWNLHVGPSQCAVFLSDVHNGREVTVSGESPAGAASSFLLFDSVEEARAFGFQKVQQIEHLRCDLYDHRGSAAPLTQIVSPKYRRRLPSVASARRMVIAACLLILVSPALFWWDWQKSGGLIFPTLLGINCIVAALRLFYLAYATLLASRRIE
jgi:hypothetical protein